MLNYGLCSGLALAKITIESQRYRNYPYTRVYFVDIDTAYG